LRAQALSTQHNREYAARRKGCRYPSRRWERGAPSPRPYLARLPSLEYRGHFLVKKITTGGTFRFRRNLVYLANALTDQHAGLEETDDGIWAIYFNTVLIGTLDERDHIIRE
jgi:hypothetical protein